MRRRQWSSKEKFDIVLEGLKGQKDIQALCTKYNLSPAQYYRWRDQFMKFGYHAFESKKTTQTEKRLREDNRRLKHILEELAVELKKINLGAGYEENPNNIEKRDEK